MWITSGTQSRPSVSARESITLNQTMCGDAQYIYIYIFLVSSHLSRFFFSKPSIPISSCWPATCDRLRTGNLPVGAWWRSTGCAVCCDAGALKQKKQEAPPPQPSCVQQSGRGGRCGVGERPPSPRRPCAKTKTKQQTRKKKRKKEKNATCLLGDGRGRKEGAGER